MRIPSTKEEDRLLDIFEQYCYLDDNLDVKFVKDTPMEALRAYDEYVRISRERYDSAMNSVLNDTGTLYG